MPTRIFYRLLLALALVFAQTGGAVHALSHAGDPPGHRDAHHSPAQTPQCDLCHAFAAADSADAPPAPRAVVPAVAAPAPAAEHESCFVVSDPSPYSGRAPPSIS
ncbi:MAG: hypothetical protein MUF79_04430 [Burkholderiales bacterium]|nr:hypothetical protein [Burkholderiales bacterium]